jgi:hypothetical protein
MRSLKMIHLADGDWRWIVRSPHLGRVEKVRVAFPRPIDLTWFLDMPPARQLRVFYCSSFSTCDDRRGIVGV